MYAIASSFLDTSLKLSALEMAEIVGVVSLIVGKPKRFSSCLTLFLHCTASAGVLLPLGQAIAVLPARVLCLRWACWLSRRIVMGPGVEIGGNPCQDASYACLIELDILGSFLGSGT